jgi:hypothetical protein
MFFVTEKGFTLVPHSSGILRRRFFRLGLCGEPCRRPANIKKDNLDSLRFLFLWHSRFTPVMFSELSSEKLVARALPVACG